MKRSVDLIGQRFGRLEVGAKTHVGHETGWVCRCDCGSQKVVSSRRLTSGETLSCGCLRRQGPHGNAHRGKKSPTYLVWETMRARCNRPSATSYQYYGGRGIRICERWELFANFLADMGERPDGMTLDRRDNDGNYEPSNCRWATRGEQNANKRTTLLVEYQGRRQSLKLWCDELRLNYDRTYYRLNAGHPVNAAFSTRKLAP